MTKSELPDGVPADNRKDAVTSASFSAATNARESGFMAPQTAIPGFTRPTTSAGKSTDARLTEQTADFSRVVVVVEDEDGDETSSRADREDDDDDKAIEPPHPPWLLLVAIAGALSLLAFYVVNQNSGEGPAYCSQQPIWNQYNCDPG